MASVPRASSATRQVSRSESATTLPEIPLLAPLEPISVPRQRTNDSLTVTASSVTSHDTFMTALTSSPSPNSPSVPKSDSYLSPSHSLRKSLSVDSFIKNRRSTDLSEPGPSSSVHRKDHSRSSFDSDSGIEHDEQHWDRKRVPGALTAERPPRPIPNQSFASRILGRSRGHSLSGPAVVEYDDPYLDDSEYERTADMAHLPLLSSNRTRSASSPHVNGYARGKRQRQGDVLLLPPRAPTISNASSASSLSNVPNSSFTDNVPPVPPIPNLHHRRPNIPGPLVMPRTRSESLSRRNSECYSGSDVVIAVVGVLGCGKSTLIKKGLKNWGLSEESVCSVATSKGRLRYTTRTISIPPGQQSARLAQILELDSDSLQLDTPDGAWPDGLPHIDGVLVCYDASDMASFSRVPDLLACYRQLHLCSVAVACKCDLEKKVPPQWASDRAMQYNVGLVEITFTSDAGKKKMRHCFSWMLRAIAQAKRGEHRAGSPYRNPASPDVLTAPWADGFPETRASNVRSRGSTPSAGSPPAGTKFREHPLTTSLYIPSSPPGGTSTPTPRSPSAPTSPTRVRSTGDLLSEVERSKKESFEGRGGGVSSLVRAASASVGSLHETQENQDVDQTMDESVGLLEGDGSGVRKDSRSKDNEPPPMPWATLEELLEKLFFLAVSGDDATFIDHFFLTYRKFATPRSVLLGMQKRIRKLNMDHTDMLLGSYAQMRICDLLEEWIEQYPNDFATPGAPGALSALVKQLLLNPSTVHYGSDLLPFLDELPNLHDLDASWSMKIEDEPPDESDDDGTGLLDDVGYQRPFTEPVHVPPAAAPAPAESPTELKVKPVPTRERKGSMSSKSLLSNPLTTTVSGSSENSRVSTKSAPKASIKELLRVSQALSQYSMQEVAHEITRQQSELFMSIEPRQWLRYTMGSCRSESEKEPISGSAAFYNRLSNWVTSLILAQDRPKARSRQVERFSELAGLLRNLNNYAGFRAVVTGINNATYPNDEVMALFSQNKRKEYKSYLSYVVLLNSSRNHRAYRMALKHTTGPAIPDMEVHTFDMVRAHESNDDCKAEDPSKIHWGKFTLMARMITTLHGFQKKIASTHKYNFTEQPHIRLLMTEAEPMDEEMQQSRVLAPPDDAYEVPYPPSLGVDPAPNAVKLDAARFKRLFFW